MPNIQLNTIEEALEDFQRGEFVIVVDDEDRENEGDFIIAAEKVTPEKINFMMRLNLRCRFPQILLYTRRHLLLPWTDSARAVRRACLCTTVLRLSLL